MQQDISLPATSSSPKLRVLHSLAALRSGGVDVLLYNYYKCMDHSKIAFDFIVHVPDNGMVERQLENMDSRVYHLARFRHGLANFFRTRRIIKEGKYTILHAHHTRKSFLQLLAAWSCGVKVRIAHSHDCLIHHGLERLLLGMSARLTTMMATDYFACGELAGRYVFGDKINSKHYQLIRNAICVDDFRFSEETRNAVRAKYHLEDAFVLLHVGRFTDQKNHMRLLRIFEKVQLRRPQARLVLIGIGELQDMVRDRAQSMGLMDKIMFVGETPDVSSFLQAADRFVFPSVHEGLGIVLIEAQAAGLPCIASAVCVPEEANVAGLVRYVSLGESDDTWADNILDHCTQNRSTGAELVRQAGYDLPTEAAKLQQWYLSHSGMPE